MIKYFYKKLKKLKTLEPNDETNKIFSELCNFSINNKKNIKITKEVEEINKICAKSEFEMEKFWAKKIIESDDTEKELKKFWYFENYEKLTSLEFLNVKFFEENIKNILFLGGGPLPLTAIILAKKYDCNCKIIDLDESAIFLAKKLVEKLGLDKKIIFQKADALEYFDKKTYDLTYCASLIFGENQENILKNIKNLNSKYFLARTVHKGRKLLYKKIEKKYLKKYFDEKLIVHPKNEIINSFLILTKKYVTKK